MTNCFYPLHSKLSQVLLPVTFEVLVAITKKNTVHCDIVQSDKNLQTTCNKLLPPISRYLLALALALALAKRRPMSC